MNKKQQKKRKRNFEVNSVTMEYFLNSYYNSIESPLLAKFYHYYFKGCTHEQMSIKIEQLMKMLKQPKKEEIQDEALIALYQFEGELKKLSKTFKRTAIQYVKASDVLTGSTILVSDMTKKKEKAYYVTPIFRNQYESFYEKEQRMKKQKVKKKD